MDKHCVILAGPNGSGKTTFAREFLLLHDWPFLNADEIAAEISPGDVAAAAMEAGRQLLVRLKQAVDKGRNFVLESTLSGLTLRRTIQECRSLGYIVSIYFIFLGAAEQNIQRIRNRVAKGGHFVPDIDVRRRYGRSLRNFWNNYRLLANRWELIYNSGDSFRQVATGAEEQYLVRDEQLFRLFESRVEDSQT